MAHIRTTWMGGAFVILAAASARAEAPKAVWQIGTGRRMRAFRGHSDAVRDVAVGAQGTLVVSVSDDHTVQVWEDEGEARLWARSRNRGRRWSR